MMSQRARSTSIMQLTFPVGEMKPVEVNTSRSTGCGLAVVVDVSGADCVADAVVAADDALVRAGSGELAHADRVSKAVEPATAKMPG